MAFYLMLAQMFPSTKFLAALFACVLHAAGVLLLRSPVAYNVIAHEPLCYPNQANLVAGRFYIEICIVIY
jgi:hypothetical protein